MQTKEQARSRILELCSESECGSWEFWSTKENKTKEEAKSIFDAIVELLREKKISALTHKFQGPYNLADVDIDRLKNEIEKSMIAYNVDPDTFYWFEATEDGKKEDLLLRST